MHGAADWHNLASDLTKAASPNTFICVLDLMELQLMATAGTDPRALELNLLNRFEAMVKNGTAFIRGGKRVPIGTDDN